MTVLSVQEVVPDRPHCSVIRGGGWCCSLVVALQSSITPNHLFPPLPLDNHVFSLLPLASSPVIPAMVFYLGPSISGSSHSLASQFRGKIRYSWLSPCVPLFRRLVLMVKRYQSTVRGCLEFLSSCFMSDLFFNYAGVWPLVHLTT